jgi:oligopeptidase B
MLDESIPLTVGEYEEWGNPNEEDSYWYMLNYSPYDNIHKLDYPAMFITTGYHDSQVQYWEPLKWVAKIREYRTNSNPLLFDCNMDAGHGGGSGRTSERTEIAKVYSFILNQENIKK